MYLKRMTVTSTNNKNEDVIIWAADVNIFIPKFIFLCFVKRALIKSINFKTSKLLSAIYFKYLSPTKTTKANRSGR